MESLKTGERRTVTVLFSDMKDFTALSGRLDPEEMDALMNGVFSRFETVVKGYGGVVEKYIGDALVAVFGVPTIHEDDPTRAVNAALDFLEEIQATNQSLRNRSIEIGFRTGINTGLITTGKRGDYEVVTGHAMSVASRLESSAPLNTIVLSLSTKEKCEADFRFSDAFTVSMKGKEAPVTAYRVEGKITGLSAESAPFVGREELADRIFRSYIKHDDRTTGGYCLTGEPGIGKTSLALQIIARISRLPEFEPPMLYARPRRYRKRNFAVITDLLLYYLRFDANRDTLESRLRDELAVEEETARGFAEFVRGETRLDNDAFVMLYVLLGAIIRKHSQSPYPVLLFIDNIHHIDRQSRDFFQFFLKNAQVKPFFLLAGRQAHPVLSSIFDDLERVVLPSLSRDDCIRLAEQLWPESDPDLVERILSYSDGNPLFIKEYVKFVKENPDSGSLPMTIQNIFLASLEKYDDRMESLLKKLSTFVRSFSLDEAMFVQEETEGDSAAVECILSFFLREGILIQEEDYYSFKHEIFRRALYGSLLNHNKKLLHGLIAGKLMHAKTRDAVGILHHLVRAGNYVDAKKVLLEEAEHVYYNTEYLPFIDILSEHLEPDDYDSLIQCLFMKSAILFNNGKMEGADSILKQILRISILQRNTGFSALAYHLLGAYNLKAYCFDKAAICGKKALAYYGRAAEGQSEGNVQNILSHLALVEVLRNRPEESLSYIGRMTDYEEPERKFAKISARGEYHLLLGEYRKTLDILNASLKELRDSRTETWFSYQILLSRTLRHLCDFESLEETLRSLLEFGTRHNSLLSQFHAQLALCRCIRKESPVEQLRQAEYLSQQIRNDFDLANALRTLAMAYFTAGNEEKAEDIAREGISIGLRHSTSYPTFSLLILLAEISLNRKAESDARFYLEESTFIADQDLLLDRKDLMLYHYFLHRLNDSAPEPLLEAQKLLRIEEGEIREKRLIGKLLSLRSFGRIPQAPEVDNPHHV